MTSGIRLIRLNQKVRVSESWFFRLMIHKDTADSGVKTDPKVVRIGWVWELGKPDEFSVVMRSRNLARDDDDSAGRGILEKANAWL